MVDRKPSQGLPNIGTTYGKFTGNNASIEDLRKFRATLIRSGEGPTIVPPTANAQSESNSHPIEDYSGYSDGM